ASLSEGQAIATELIKAKLATCVNFFPIDSIYLWQGEINQEREYQLIIKTDLNQFAQLSAKIKTLHSYEVPEIIALPIVNGSQAYLNWLGSSLED
ncbi:MAG: divalent-cation tolerance protein CutA, partial [Cyanobacteria bacterium J06623_1]